MHLLSKKADVSLCMWRLQRFVSVECLNIVSVCLDKSLVCWAIFMAMMDQVDKICVARTDKLVRPDQVMTGC